MMRYILATRVAPGLLAYVKEPNEYGDTVMWTDNPKLAGQYITRRLAIAEANLCVSLGVSHIILLAICEHCYYATQAEIIKK